jgi:hypothetical protein
MKKKYYWKVVSEYNENGLHILQSCVVRMEAFNIYQKGFWTFAPYWLTQQGRYLCVFYYLKDAIKFYKKQNTSSNPCHIFKCVVKDEAQRKPICDCYSLSQGKIFPIRGSRWPAGTRFFKQVKLIKEKVI